MTLFNGGCAVHRAITIYMIMVIEYTEPQRHA